METAESIEYRFNEAKEKNFRCGWIYGAILGTVIALFGVGRDSYQTGNIPFVYQPSKSNTAIIFTGAAIMGISMAIPITLNLRAKRRRDNELESLSETDNDNIDPPYLV